MHTRCLCLSTPGISGTRKLCPINLSLTTSDGAVGSEDSLFVLNRCGMKNVGTCSSASPVEYFPLSMFSPVKGPTAATTAETQQRRN